MSCLQELTPRDTRPPREVCCSTSAVLQTTLRRGTGLGMNQVASEHSLEATSTFYSTFQQMLTQLSKSH